MARKITMDDITLNTGPDNAIVTPNKKLVLATQNLGKVRELTALLNRYLTPSEHCLIQILTLQEFPNAPDVVEDGETYAENATKKAKVIANYTGYLTLADDAGLEVDALAGAPGIKSKRWASEETLVTKLLRVLEKDTRRTARFVTAIALASPNSEPDVVTGICEGSIAQMSAGESGFGYDVVFVPAGYNKTFSQLGDEVKNRISHRAKALQLVLPLLRKKVEKSMERC